VEDWEARVGASVALKEALASATTLAHPDLQLLTRLLTDASAEGRLLLSPPCPADAQTSTS
jgi:hypothetical protein